MTFHTPIEMEPRIFLRPLEESDLERVKHWLNRPDISSIMGYLPILSSHEQLLWYKGIKNLRSTFVFAICRSSTGEHIGNVGVGNIDYIHRHGMLNIFIAEHEHHGKGFGTQAVKEALSFAFERLNLNKVFLQTSRRFDAAMKVYKNLGFQQDGVLREHFFANGEFEDKILFSILRSEFRHEQ